MVSQGAVFVEHNTIVLPYFGQISKTIKFMLKTFLIHTTLGKGLIDRFEKSGNLWRCYII